MTDEVEIGSKKYRAITEGKAKILFPVCEDVFYNPVQQFNRDMSIAAIKTWATLHGQDPKWQKKRGDTLPRGEDGLPRYRMLEALGASGLRSVRYAKEMPLLIDKITCNDLSAEAVESIKRNVEFNDVADIVVPSEGDACDLMYRHRDIKKRFHVVDLDPYGTAAPFIDAAIQCVEEGGLLCVTCTDTAVLCGKYPDTCFAKYGGVGLRSSYCHEMALRLVLQSLQVTAARYKKKITPLLSCSIDFYVRLFVKVETSAAGVRYCATNSTMVYQCVKCPNFDFSPLGRTSVNEKGVTNFHLATTNGNPGKCSQCDSSNHIGGPMYSADIHDLDFVKEFIKHLKAAGSSELYHTHSRMLGMATVISEEVSNSMLYFQMGNCASAVKSNSPPLTTILSALLNAGYKASISHCNNNSVKTDAPHSVFWDIMRSWAEINGTFLEKLPEGSVEKAIRSHPIVTRGDFSLNPDAEPESRKVKLLRFEDHKGKNWGPKARAKKRKSTVIDQDDDQEEEK